MNKNSINVCSAQEKKIYNALIQLWLKFNHICSKTIAGKISGKISLDPHFILIAKYFARNSQNTRGDNFFN